MSDTDVGAIPIFTTLVEQKSFTRAADKLGISTSAVSKRITKLEAHLGVKLIQRSTRKLALTEAGDRYYAHASKAIRAIEEAENSATELQEIPRGLLRISAPISLGRLHLGAIIPQFLKLYPQIELHINMRDAFTKVVLDDFDIILASGEVSDASLQLKKIANLEGLICASPEYLAQHGTPKVPQDLQQHNCLVFSFHPIPRQWTFWRKGKPVTIHVSGNYQCNNAEVVREAVLQGMGIGCLPTFLIGDDIKDGRIVTFMEDYIIQNRELSAAFPEKKYVPEKVSVFIDFLIDKFGGENPYWDKFKNKDLIN